MKRTDTKTLIKAARVLARDIHSEDGVANAALAEIADRLEEMEWIIFHYQGYARTAQMVIDDYLPAGHLSAVELSKSFEAFHRLWKRKSWRKKL